MIAFPPQRTPSRLEKLVAAQNGLCHYCKESFGPPELEANPTRDHIIPQSVGGTNEPHNLVAACARCNHSKGSLRAHEFIAIIKSGRLRPRRDLSKLGKGRSFGRLSARASVTSIRPVTTDCQNPPKPKLAKAPVVNPPFSKNKPLKRLYYLEDLVREWDEDRYAKKTGVEAS